MSSIVREVCNTFCPLAGKSSIESSTSTHTSSVAQMAVCSGSRLIDRDDDKKTGYYEVRNCPKWLLEGFAVLNSDGKQYIVQDKQKRNS